MGKGNSENLSHLFQESCRIGIFSKDFIYLESMQRGRAEGKGERTPSRPNMGLDR